MSALMVVLGAAVGAPLRYALTHSLDRRWPAGTLLANLVGSALVGYFAALSLSGHVWALLATGLCGALTSFSTFAVQVVDGKTLHAAAYTTATVLSTLALCGAGFWLGSLG